MTIATSIKGVGLDFSFFGVQKVTQCLIQPKVTLLLILLLLPPKGLGNPQSWGGVLVRRLAHMDSVLMSG